ncbi:MAG: hypothetical protein GY719_20330, partial [bacterium]|nr:hypothetical protein [bacterium]
MTCVQRFLANDRNAVASGSITATEVKESAQSVHRGTVTRTGNGVVALTGSYTGADDATFEVEITAGGTTKRVSEPTWAGAGLGTLATPTATNAVAAQTFTVTLIDRGTDTLHAKTQIAGVEIQAITAGAGGNAITLTVDASGLSRAATDYSTLSSWGTGEDSKVG